jgi:hypothetical protein
MAKDSVRFLTNSHPVIVFEDSEVGRLKKQIVNAPMAEYRRDAKGVWCPVSLEARKGRLIYSDDITSASERYSLGRPAPFNSCVPSL